MLIYNDVMRHRGHTLTFEQHLKGIRLRCIHCDDVIRTFYPPKKKATKKGN